MHPVYHFSFAYAWRFALSALFMIACWGMYFYSVDLLNKTLIAVNEHLPPDRKITFIPWNRSVDGRIRREYRRLFPDGDLIRRYWLAVGAAAILFASALFVPWNLLS